MTGPAFDFLTEQCVRVEKFLRPLEIGAVRGEEPER
jgi:hypothetical protein